jgi:hypothetical protein
MSREKQIEEMAKDLCDIECKGMKCNICDSYGCEYRMQAEALYNAGYRKQKEGEWKLHKDGSGTCSECHFIQKDIWDYDHYQHFCGHCGAKMKGGAE